MTRMKLASIEIANGKGYIFPTLSFIDGIVSHHKSIDPSRYHQLRFVVGEILKTRVEKAFPGSIGQIYVEIYLTESYIEISIRDKGEPSWHDFEYDKERIDEDDKCLRNYIIDHYVDEIGMEKLGSDGQRIFARKNILNALEFKAPEPYPETEALDTNITIRPVVTKEDVIEAIRCIYSEYGYSYSYERLYYVDSFMKLLESKEIMSFLAVNDHGQTAGHFILSFTKFYEGMPEISTVVVRKEFRGLGLFSKFIKHCEEIGNQNGIRALMAQPVTFHPMSQKAFLREGYTATSLLMSYLPDDVESEYNQNSERLGLSACVKMIDKNASTTICPPKEVKGFVTKVLDKLGINYEVSDTKKLSDSTRMNIDSIKQHRMSKIVAYEVGEDFPSELISATKDAIKVKNEMVELVLVLNSPSCEYAYEIAKKTGYKFSGIIPGAGNGDYLIMQTLLGDDFNYDNLVTVGEFEEIKNDIINLIG